MHSGPGVLSAAQMVPEGHGGEDEAERDDERVGNYFRISALNLSQTARVSTDVYILYTNSATHEPKRQSGEATGGAAPIRQQV